MRDLPKETLYDGVKTLLEAGETTPHIHLNQHKLFTLFSLAFQYMLYLSTKEVGAYIIRVEDSMLADKLGRKAKDASTRRFINSLLLPRKLKYGRSVFYLDFFHVGSWAMTNEIPKDKIKGAIIVKNTSARPMDDLMAEEEENPMAGLPADYFLSSLKEFSPRTITVAYGSQFDGLRNVEFSFIPKEKSRAPKGVTISADIDWDAIED